MRMRAGYDSYEVLNYLVLQKKMKRDKVIEDFTMWIKNYAHLSRKIHLAQWVRYMKNHLPQLCVIHFDCKP